MEASSSIGNVSETYSYKLRQIKSSRFSNGISSKTAYYNSPVHKFTGTGQGKSFKTLVSCADFIRLGEKETLFKRGEIEIVEFVTSTREDRVISVNDFMKSEEDNLRTNAAQLLAKAQECLGNASADDLREMIKKLPTVTRK